MTKHVSIVHIAEFVSVLTCSLFAGASVYVSLVEHPARMECGVEVAMTEFRPSYRRGAIMQGTLATLGLLSSITAWLAGATFWWPIAGVLLGSVVPFTLIVILPTNKLLLGSTVEKQSAQAERLLARWGALQRLARPVCSGKSKIPGIKIQDTRHDSPDGSAAPRWAAIESPISMPELRRIQATSINGNTFNLQRIDFGS